MNSSERLRLLFGCKLLLWVLNFTEGVRSFSDYFYLEDCVGYMNNWGIYGNPVVPSHCQAVSARHRDVKG